MNKINVSEHFYSLQGEGPSIGKPSYFIRLQACNLQCKFCDTIDVWKKGSPRRVSDLVNSVVAASPSNRNIGIVITGGEPLLQQAGVAELIRSLRDKDFRHFEIETAGTIMPSDELFTLVTQWNVSPKLENSEMSIRRRFHKDVLSQLACLPHSYFKFPVGSDYDMAEVEDIIQLCNMKSTKVFLMPICDTRDDFLKVAPIVADICKKKGYNFSPRLQLVLWDQTCGV